MHRLARSAARVALRPTQRPGLRSSRVSYATSSKKSGPTANFYKTFTRPVAKVLAVAVFTYQCLYVGWMKLDAVEHQEKTDAEIAELEAQVAALEKAREMEGEKKKDTEKQKSR
ncbi:uncharacterized protein CPUR_03878 [Claviceps purpurea 20.1]|uniref:Uncharacterized protein n=1 Tax=Claviceps purpurea (strain 20.1) TaxID=1111077 RepID=M1W5Q7_CLAP2|nr:uncharacterized protein CPUR_03878 [Claviceps purpurea 20.1]